MSAQKVREKISVAKMHDNERNRAALARLRAQMASSGQNRLERQIDTIVELIVGVRP